MACLARRLVGPDFTQRMLDEYNGNVAQFPSVTLWRQDFFTELRAGGTFKHIAQGGVDIHHSVEKYIQRQLGIPDALNDLCPGIPMPRSKGILDDLNRNFDPANQLKQIHGGPANEGGLAGILKSRIPTRNASPDRQAIIDELFKVHTVDYPQYRNIWPVARDWLRDLQLHGFLEQTLNIP